jgi:hypothetical protein
VAAGWSPASTPTRAVLGYDPRGFYKDGLCKLFLLAGSLKRVDDAAASASSFQVNTNDFSWKK